MSESELEEQIRAQIGDVRLHRKRILTPFSHVADEPLVDVLFSITRRWGTVDGGRTIR